MFLILSIWNQDVSRCRFRRCIMVHTIHYVRQPEKWLHKDAAGCLNKMNMEAEYKISPTWLVYLIKWIAFSWEGIKSHLQPNSIHKIYSRNPPSSIQLKVTLFSQKTNRKRKRSPVHWELQGHCPRRPPLLLSEDFTDPPPKTSPSFSPTFFSWSCLWLQFSLVLLSL